MLRDVFYLSVGSSAVRVGDAKLEALGVLGLGWGDKSGFAPGEEPKCLHSA